MNNLFSTHPAWMDASTPWQMGFQDPATPTMEGIIDFHDDIMFLLIAIGVFVGYLMVRTIQLFNEDANSLYFS